MQADLQDLEFTKAEIKNLSGVDLEKLLRYSLCLGFYFIIFFIPLILFFCLGFYYILLMIKPSIFMNYHSSSGAVALEVVLSLISAGISSIKIAQIIDNANKLEKLNKKYNLRKKDIYFLLNIEKDIEKFNAVVKAIDVHDQLEEAGNKGISLSDRNKVIEALKLARADLVGALKTEKILRDNKGIITIQAELFANNLSSLKAIQVNCQANEYSQILNNALHIAVNVQEEMSKLQN